MKLYCKEKITWLPAFSFLLAMIFWLPALYCTSPTVGAQAHASLLS